MRPKGADGMANSIDPDQTAPDLDLTYLSEDLGTLWYIYVVFLLQAVLTVFAVRRYREGTSEQFTSGYQDNQQQNQSSPYSSFPGSDSGDPYQQPPFSNQQKDIPDYQPPTY